VTEPRSPPVFVPLAALEPDTLVRLVQAFVLREGTDYGRHEYSLEQKVAHVRAQLERGDARIVFDPETETVDIVTATQATQLSASGNEP
jgi:hypothetical protein